MAKLESLAFGVGFAALVAVSSGLFARAQAATATLSGSEEKLGYGRIALRFDEAPLTRIRVANGVLIVAFDAAVKVSLDRIAREMPAYVSVARLDPDGRGLRLALTRPWRANLIEAGDKVFIDLLPETWQGLLPGPPPEVIAELTERARRAEARARESEQRRQAPARAPLGVRVARLPTLDRLIFDAGPDVAVTPEIGPGKVGLVFDRPLQLEPAALRPLLPAGVTLEAVRQEAASLRLALALPADWKARAYRDDDGFVLDLVAPDKGKPARAVTLDAAAPAPPAPPAVVGDKAAKPAPAPALPPDIVPADAPPPAPAPVVVAPPPPAAPQPITVRSVQHADGARLDLVFPRPTGAAAFETAGRVTLAFDTADTLDPGLLAGLLAPVIESAGVTREGRLVLVTLDLRQRQVMRLAAQGTTWSVVFGEAGLQPVEGLVPKRAIDERGQTVVSVPVTGMTGIHWLGPRPDATALAIVTVEGAARAVTKPYRFVEFGLPQTAQGLVVATAADDVVVRAGTGEVTIGRAAGLTLTVAQAEAAPAETGAAPASPLVEREAWMEMRAGATRNRAEALLRDVVEASRGKKSEARLKLATFLTANELASEAAGPLSALLADDPAMRTRREPLLLRGITAVMMHRNAEAITALQAPSLRGDPEAVLWRALAETRLGRHGAAFPAFRRAESLIDLYPDAFQARFRLAMARAAIDARDLGVAEHQLEALSAMPPDFVDRDEVALLRAMLDEAAGRAEPALAGYRALFEAASRPVSVEAQLRGVTLARAENRTEIKPQEATERLETIAAVWRGGESEIAALGQLGGIYAERKLWREAFDVAKRANAVFPDHAVTRKLHDETSQQFERLFAGGEADQLPKLDALALFYDFKEFLPIGRRGDEITRLLADRLVELDLLDQAADILSYQMERRLSGAARSIVATRLAMIRLMNARPAEALAALHATRLSELPRDVKRARLLLEGKALSDLSRTDQALELLEQETGPEVERLRAEILWSGRRWRDAGEAHERMLGESWRGTAPLSDGERGDVMRAAVAYVMSGEALALDRLRTKFAARMAESADARTFAFVTAANRNSTADIREMARSVSGAEALNEFMKAYRKRYPDFATRLRGKPEAPAQGAAGAGATPGAG